MKTCLSQLDLSQVNLVRFSEMFARAQDLAGSWLVAHGVAGAYDDTHHELHTCIDELLSSDDHQVMEDFSEKYCHASADVRAEACGAYTPRIDAAFIYGLALGTAAEACLRSMDADKQRKPEEHRTAAQAVA